MTPSFRAVAVLARRAARESRATVAWCCVGMFVVVFLGTRVLPPLHGAVSGIAAQVPLVKALVAASLGQQSADALTTSVLMGLLWAHPFVMALAWTPALVLCTRYPAGELETGTIDMTLGWPVSRIEVALGEAAVWLGAGLPVMASAFAAWWLGRPTDGLEGLPDATLTAQVLANLFAAYLAVGGFASAVSAWSSERGRATGIVFGAVFTSYLITVVAPFWPPAAAVRALGVLTYYTPGRVLASRALDAQNVQVLLAIFLLCEGIALWRIATRPLSTT
ncbi:MAG: hypothetical protein EB084_22400 [Proteobacteria bacterium]|nr:hypothetical protein [Pseudomonadota bacterium]